MQSANYVDGKKSLENEREEKFRDAKTFVYVLYMYKVGWVSEREESL